MCSSKQELRSEWSAWTGIVRKYSWRWSLEARHREGAQDGGDTGKGERKNVGGGVCVYKTLSWLEGQREGSRLDTVKPGCGSP